MKWWPKGQEETRDDLVERLASAVDEQARITERLIAVTEDLKRLNQIEQKDSDAP